MHMHMHMRVSALRGPRPARAPSQVGALLSCSVYWEHAVVHAAAEALSVGRVAASAVSLSAGGR